MDTIPIIVLVALFALFAMDFLVLISVTRGAR
jgi:hypothetical protein